MYLGYDVGEAKESPRMYFEEGRGSWGKFMRMYFGGRVRMYFGKFMRKP